MDVTQTLLNKASEQLLSQLPDKVGPLIESMAKDRGIPIWHYVCGILLEIHTEGRLSAITIDPSWKSGFRQKVLTCAQCKKEYPPVRLNQVYCSNKCGEIALYEERLKTLPLPIRPKNTKNVKAIEDYEQETKLRNEIVEIIKLLKGDIPEPEVVEPLKRESHGTDRGGEKHIADNSGVSLDSGWVDNPVEIDIEADESKPELQSASARG